MSVNVSGRDRQVIINPLVTCMPMGAMWAVLGINRGIPLVQGSQGCSTFVRYHLARHFREPIEIAVSSFHESTAVFGGKKNLNISLKTIVQRQNPDLIGVVTTCSSEIIGDDVYGFVESNKEELKDLGHDNTEIIPINTPSFAGSHFVGYNKAVDALIKNLTVINENNEGDDNKINIIPGLLNPGDVNEIKHILDVMHVPYTILTDISETFNSPLNPKKQEHPYFGKGGTTVDEIRNISANKGTISITKYAKTGAETLEQTHKVPAVTDNLPPIGIKGTDDFIMTVNKLTKHDILDTLMTERGLTLDLMADVSARYLAGRKVVIFGDPTLVTGLTSFIIEIGMEPVMVTTGSEEKTFPTDIENMSKGQNIDVITEGDLKVVEDYVKDKDNGVELILGSSEARFINYDTGIPLVRFGFPVYDRVGYHSQPIVGYRGAKRVVEMITNEVLAKYYEEKHWKLQQ
ncbi:MAG: nitrogenase molybdenum-iron protein subunit beta [Methanobrevibacter sp.]|jgi:nitrogenase molybdenum-iron protein beta chain|nr:nitrogenase molybdenum-iron protein subunit beta [Candidatus Methanovirga basalitermitum]